MRLGLTLGALAGTVVLAACGGAGASSTTTISSTPTATTSSSASPAAPTASTEAGTATTSVSSTASSTPTVTTASSPELPASYTIRPGGSLRPVTVGAPAHTTVLMTFVSGDRRAHVVAIQTHPVHALRVPAGGSAHVILKGLANGQYPISVDRVNQGKLIIGVAPGP